MRKTKKHKYNMKGCSSKKRKYLGGYNPVYPNTGGHNFPGWIGSQTIRGGSCGCNKQMGGNCTSCMKQMGGNCTSCMKQMGGNCTSCMKQMGGNNGLPFGGSLPPMKAPLVPNGLTGDAWGANFKWPGTSLIQGNNNHFSLNKYVPDVVTAIKNVGANFPFTGGAKKSKKRRKRRKQKGAGWFSNSLLQDGLNAVRYSNYQSAQFINDLQGGNETYTNPLPYSQPALIK